MSTVFTDEYDPPSFPEQGSEKAGVAIKNKMSRDWAAARCILARQTRLDLLRFSLFCASLTDNLATLAVFTLSHS